MILNDESLGSERVRFVFHPSTELATCAIYRCHGFSCVLQMEDTEDSLLSLCVFEDSSLIWLGTRHRACGQIFRLDLPLHWMEMSQSLPNFQFLVSWIEKIRDYLKSSSVSKGYGQREWIAFQENLQSKLDSISDRDFEAEFLRKQSNGLLVLSKAFSDLSLGTERRMSRQIEIPLCELTLLELGKQNSGFATAFDQLLNSLIDELTSSYSRVA